MPIYYKTCDALVPVPLARRQQIANAATDRATHGRLVAEFSTLQQIEVKAPPCSAVSHNDSLKIVFWNAERCKYPQASAELLATQQADMILLCEMDRGMARSWQRHTPRKLAARLEMGYAFAVEYLELGLGDSRERSWHAGQENRDGLHGSALLSPYPLQNPVLIRLEHSGDWFDGSRGERRIGGRMALAASMPLGQGELTVVSAHLESHGDPSQRAAQTRLLLQALERYAPAAPVLIGGDFNTKSASRTALKNPAEKRALMRHDPERLVNPVPYEPLFEIIRDYGYQWQSCNAPGVTQRSRPDGTPKPPFARLDWFFSRGVQITQAQTIAAVDERGQALSDHEVLSVRVTYS